MSIPTPRLRFMSLIGLTLVGSWLTPAPTRAGLHKRQKTHVSVYTQQAPASSYSAAPAPVTYTTQAPTVYSAPAPTYLAAPAPAPVYSAPAPVYAAPAPTYSAPAPVYSAPAPTAYAAPVQLQMQAPQQAQVFVGNAPGAIGNAPGAIGNAPGANVGSRIRAVDRADIIEELHSEYREGGTDGTRRERRNALRESARTRFSEAIGEATGEDVESLNASELQDIENIVNSIVDSTATQQGKAQMAPGEAPNAYYAPTMNFAPVSTVASYVPVVQAPLIQPVVPVQLFLPVRPKHKLFHHNRTR